VSSNNGTQPGRDEAISLLAAHWPEPGNGRQDAALALAGGLLRAGLTVEDVEGLLEDVLELARDEEAEKRLAVVQGTAARLAAGERVVGWPRLAELIGNGNGDVLQRVRQLLALEGDPKVVAVYDYLDEAGVLRYQVVRYAPKTFKQRRPDGNGGWHWNMQGVQRLPYRLPELLAADPTVPVFVPEGEKDVEALRDLGLVATCNPGGAGKWRSEFNGPLRGRHVVGLADNDGKGREHAGEVATSLTGTAASVKVLELPGLPPGGDISDWLAAGGTAGELLRLAAEAPAYEPPAPPGDPPLPEPRPWPEPLAEEAFHGLAGRIVRAIEPASEADPAALLVQLLIAFGNVIDRVAHATAEADDHYGNEFVVLVGQTSKARKGSSWGRIRRFLARVDSEWAGHCISGGLSSGEGLTWAVRDPIISRQAVKEKGRVVDYEEVETDPGVSDKRLLVVEPEFATVLRMNERQGNTLSARIRMAWDTGDIRTLVRHDPVRATGAHISILGHITAAELTRYLTTTEAASGFGNRHLWVCSQRSKCLPEGGQVDEAALAELAEEMKKAVEFARGQRPRPAGVLPLHPEPPAVLHLRRDADARAVWAAVYPELSEGRPGLAGALLARAEAHVLRLSMLYALLDKSSVIRAEHLLAALAVWQYAEQSVYCIFGDSLGDPLADDLLRLLRVSPEGLTRTDMQQYLGRHQSSDRIGRALGLLLEHRLVRREQQPSTGGRPAERWFAEGGAR
jgi:hypothetical protein